jgi:hypothetical protein
MKTELKNILRAIGMLCLCVANFAHADTVKLEDLLA